MKKLLFFIIFLIGFSDFLSARQRTLAEMQNVAANVLQSNAKERQTRATPINSGLSVIESNSQITVFGSKNLGFAIVSNDDQFDPVLGYSDNYDGTIAPSCRWFLEALSKSLQYMSEKGTPVVVVKKAADYKPAVSEMLSSRWNQEEPFNNLCPKYYDASGTTVAGRYVTGCVATAMAQIMYYNKYPDVGVGSKYYRFTPENGTSMGISSIFRNHTYDWANMLDVYKSGAYTSTQSDAVAQIMYDCGVSVSMQYSKDGSGAYSSDACLALRKYFNYDKNIKMFCRDYYPVDEWMNLIYKEINDGCPILYSGQSSTGGHSFVFDGYNENGLVHVNWGWGGLSNGYFNIASLNGFSSSQDLVQVRKPMGLPYYSIWGLSSNLNCQKKTATTFSVGSNGKIFNLDVEAFSGNLGIIIQSTSDATKQYVAYTQPENINAYGVDGKIYDAALSTQTIDISSLGLADGEYRIYLGTKSSSETEWRAIRSKEDVKNSSIMTITNGNLTLTDETSVWTDIRNVETDNSSNNIVRVYDTTGREVYRAPAYSFHTSDIPAKGVLIIRNGTSVKKIMK